MEEEGTAESAMEEKGKSDSSPVGVLEKLNGRAVESLVAIGASES